MNTPPDLVCIGRVVREMIYFPDQVKGPVLGSPPAYCSVAAARQGTHVGIVSIIGPDMSEDLLKPILQAGVNTTGLLKRDSSTASELIYDSQGNKEIRYPSMSEPICAEDIPANYVGCRLVYVCPMDEDVLLDQLASVVSKGHVSAVDLGGYGGVHMSKLRRQSFPSLKKLALEVASHFQIVKASDEDAESIFGKSDPVYAAKQLIDCGPEVVVMTLGKLGALVQTRKQSWHVPPISGYVLDTTGGGDTFMAGFLSEFLRSGEPLKSAQWGCATAICVIEETGGVRVERMPTRPQIQTRFEKAYG